jgi:hypothetical protein
MKIGLMTITLAGLLLSFTRDVQAQAYDLSYYWDGAQYQQYSPQQYYGDTSPNQQYDPYYDLHVMHYQLYLPQYPAYQIYPSCCVLGGIVIPGWPGPIAPQPPVVINPGPRPIRRR